MLRRLSALCLAVAVLATPAMAQPETLHIVHSNNSPPFSVTTAAGASEGFMIDVCKAIATDLGMVPEFRGLVFAELIPAVVVGDATMICTSLGYTPERAAAVDYTPAISEFGEGMVVLATDTGSYADWTAIAGQPVAAVRSTTYAIALERSGLFPALRLYDTNPQALAAVASGEARAFFTLRPIVDTLVASDFPTLRIVDGYTPSVLSTFHIGVRHGEPGLLAAVNASLAKLAGTGVLRQIRAEWGL